MLKKIAALATGAVMTLVLVPSPADASGRGQPLDVDCAVLESTLIAVDVFLDANGVDFANLGELVAGINTDPTTFGQVAGLVGAFSGGGIVFTSPQQVTSTAATCGLVPRAIELINT